MTTVQWTTSVGDRATAPDFDALFLAEHQRLVRTLTVVCGDPDVAADCVADAFERAYVRWRRVGRLEDPAGWVRRVAVNRSIDLQRRRTSGRRAIARLAGRAERSPTDVRLSDSASFHDSELAAAVAGLSPQQRAVVALHYLDDLSVADVAAALRLSDGAVKYHLHQARGRLRDTLGAELPETDAP